MRRERERRHHSPGRPLAELFVDLRHPELPSTRVRSFLAAAIIVVCTALAVVVWSLSDVSNYKTVCVDFPVDSPNESYCERVPR